MNERVLAKNKTSATPPQANQASSPLLHQSSLTSELSESVGSNSNISKELGGIQPKTIRRSLNWQNITVEAPSGSNGSSLPGGIQRQQEEPTAVIGSRVSADSAQKSPLELSNSTISTDLPAQKPLIARAPFNGRNIPIEAPPRSAEKPAPGNGAGAPSTLAGNGGAGAGASSVGNKLGFGKDEKGKDGKEDTDTDQVITESFSMAGESHTLKVTVKGNDVETIMASIPRPIQEALNEQKKTEQDLINSTSGAEQQKHITILSDLTGIEAWYSTEVTKIRGLTNKSQIGPGIKNLAEQLKQKIGVLGNTYGLKDFVYKSLGIHELLSTIQGQVKELRKHYNPSTSKGQNDGHNNTATAAEALGWSAPWGKHDTRTRTAEPILTDAINKLDDINRLYGVNVSMESDYVEGKEERDDCRLALSNPVGYLAAKGLKVDTAGNLVHL